MLRIRFNDGTPDMNIRKGVIVAYDGEMLCIVSSDKSATKKDTYLEIPVKKIKSAY